MGLLDEAIREHLELKRRAGADPDAISRQEKEALGPVRRTADPADEDALPEAELLETPVEHAPLPEPVAEEPVYEDEPVEVDEPEFVPPPADPDDFVGQPTVEYTIDEHIAATTPDEDEAESDEDVLEETPEFLQETPEHDRLWFEQKPPRDFDFDG